LCEGPGPLAPWEATVPVTWGRALAATSAVAVLAACGGSSPRAVFVSNEVTVTIVPAMEDLPFDPRGARLAEATRQLASVVGRPIAIQVDAALVPPRRSWFEEALAQSIENVARDMQALRESSPRVFAREAPLFRRIECRYVATAEREQGAFDARIGTVVVREAAEGDLVGRGVVGDALDDDYAASLDRDFGGADPARIPPARWDEYFAWAARSRAPAATPDGREATAEQRFATDPRGESLVRVARFAQLVGASNLELARRLDEHLVHEAYYLTLAYDGDADLVRRAAPGSLFRRAEAAWVAWLKGRLPALEDRLALAVAGTVMGGPRCDACIPPVDRFPGFDPLAFGLEVAEAWARAGHPSNAERTARFEVMDAVVCPVERRPNGKHERNRGCQDLLVETALLDEARTRRLAAALGQGGDAALVETLFANFKYKDAASTIRLWRSLEPYPRAWHVAALEIIEELLDDVQKKSALVGEAERAWAALPDRRGTALYLMARADADLDAYYADARWSTFGKRFGGDVSGAVFGAMLDDSPRAMPLAAVVWPALGKGWSRADVLVSRLDRFLDDPVVRSREDGEPGRTLRGVVKRMCSEGADADLARLRAYLVQRSARVAEDAAALSNLVADTAPGRCPRKPL